MPDQMWNYVYKVMDLATNPRNLAIAFAAWVVWHGPQLHLTEQQMTLLAVAIVGGVVSDMARPTSRPANAAMAETRAVAALAVSVPVPTLPEVLR